MASDTTKTRRSNRRADPRTLARFVEELSWLLSSYDELDYKALGDLSSNFAEFSRHSTVASRSQRSKTAQMLVGVLPSFFLDTEIFPTNEDIIEFSQIALGISIPRWQKKSKNELIGHIVCHTDQASPERLSRVMAALDEALSERGSARNKLASERQSGRSWNEVIQSMLRDSL
jgi:hypothetical protein